MKTGALSSRTKEPALPQAMEFVRRAEVLLLIHQDCNVYVGEDEFLLLRSEFPVWVAEWCAEKSEELRRIVRESAEFKDEMLDDADPLGLPTVAFDCTTCHAAGETDPLLFPAVLDHDCTYARMSTNDVRDLPDLFDRAVHWAAFDAIEGDCLARWSAKTLRVRRLLEHEVVTSR